MKEDLEDLEHRDWNFAKKTIFFEIKMAFYFEFGRPEDEWIKLTAQLFSQATVHKCLF